MGLKYYQDKNVPSVEDQEILANIMGSDEEVRGSQDLFQSQDMVKLVKTYLEEDYPEEIRKTKIFQQFWAILGKTIKLSFVEKDDIYEFESLFEQCRLTFLMSMPPYDISWEDLQLIDQIRVYYLAAVKRATGFGGHRFNERIILGGTINQTIRSNTESINSPAQQGRGLFSRLRSMF